MAVNMLQDRTDELRLDITKIVKIAELRKAENLTIGEMIQLKAILGLTNEEAIDIFFNKG